MKRISKVGANMLYYLTTLNLASFLSKDASMAKSISKVKYFKKVLSQKLYIV